MAAGDAPGGRLGAFGLAIDLDNAAAQSSTTFGARLVGSRALAGDLSLTWAAEYAAQTDAGANPSDYALDFQAAALGLQTPHWSGGLGVERFDGDHPAFGDADKGWLTLEYRY